MACVVIARGQRKISQNGIKIVSPQQLSLLFIEKLYLMAFRKPAEIQSSTVIRIAFFRLHGFLFAARRPKKQLLSKIETPMYVLPVLVLLITGLLRYYTPGFCFSNLY